MIISIHSPISNDWNSLVFLLVTDWKTSNKTIINLERPSHLQRYDYGMNMLIQNGLFVIQGSLYHLIPVIENYEANFWYLLSSNYENVVGHFYLYKIDIENQTIQLESKIHNFTITGGLQKFHRGFSVVPFVNSKSNEPKEHQTCDLIT